MSGFGSLPKRPIGRHDKIVHKGHELTQKAGAYCPLNTDVLSLVCIPKDLHLDLVLGPQGADQSLRSGDPICCFSSE